MRRAGVALVVLVTAALLGGCGDGGDGEGGGTASGGGGGDKDRFCELASQDDIGGLEDFDPTKTDDMQELDEALTELSESAPDDIRDDVEVVADGLREFVEVLSTIDTTDPDALAELGERAEELEEMQAEMEDATGRVDAYIEEECGVDAGS